MASGFRFDDPVLRNAFTLTSASAVAAFALLIVGPVTLRPSLGVLSLLLLLMSLGALLGSRKIWLFISLVNNLTLLIFFKYAGFVVENLNELLAWIHATARLPAPSTLMPFGASYILPVGISFFTFQSMSYTIDF